MGFFTLGYLFFCEYIYTKEEDKSLLFQLNSSIAHFLLFSTLMISAALLFLSNPPADDAAILIDLNLP